MVPGISLRHNGDQRERSFGASLRCSLEELKLSPEAPQRLLSHCMGFGHMTTLQQITDKGGKMVFFTPIMAHVEVREREVCLP